MDAEQQFLRLDLTLHSNQCLLDQWITSPLLVWVHLAPVCGTASRAPDIRLFEGDPQPLRSNEFPEGLPSLSHADAERVRPANLLFECACKLYSPLQLPWHYCDDGKSSKQLFLADVLGHPANADMAHLPWRFSGLHVGQWPRQVD